MADQVQMRIAIIGGGLSGLCTALALQQQSQFKGHVSIFESRKNYTMDRHWAYWYDAPILFKALPIVSYDDFNISNQGRMHLIKSELPYRVVRSDAIYASAIAALKSDSRFEFIHQAVQSVVAEGAGYTLNTESASTSTFDWVLDSRPIPIADTFQQWFIGAEVRFEQAHQKVNPVLMDFIEATANEPLQFFYLLPLDANTALIQYTAFLRPNEPPPIDAWPRWQTYVNAIDANNSILREENGLIPMHVVEPKPFSEKHWPIGAAAGWVRAATGYGFGDSQRAARQVAEHIVRTDEIKHRVQHHVLRARPRVDDVMDVLFLRVLSVAGGRGALYFEALFRNCPASIVVRFLSGTANWYDRLRVIWSLPTASFLRDCIEMLKR